MEVPCLQWFVPLALPGFGADAIGAGGPRLCLGQNLANFEAISGESFPGVWWGETGELMREAVMACVIRSFDLAFAEGYLENVEMLSVYKEDTPMYVNSLTLPMKEAFRVVAKRREQ